MRYTLASLFLLLSLHLSFAQGRRLHVDAYATGANNGTSWEDAFTDLQSALFAAQPGDCVWVAIGTYKPVDGFNRELSFSLKAGVKMYGGFAGVETKLEQRNWERYKTTLSGDIGLQNDETDNSYTILYIETSETETVVDGFTFTGGNADNYDPFASKFSRSKCGGAIYVKAEGKARPEIRNCSFERNYAREFGGAVYLFTGEEKEEILPFENCWFTDNRADGFSQQKKMNDSQGFRVYPNPANSMATIEGMADSSAYPLHLSLFDVSGKVVRAMEVKEMTGKLYIRVSLEGLPAGCYNYQIADAEKAILDSGKLWKQ
ncbi:MAG: T9SS type A sorting domain-containing protein [Saprospiraceae bacterium]|nr:T9SS type A sorting domain-containing protein [Saprospiraceae bacterium]